MKASAGIHVSSHGRPEVLDVMVLKVPQSIREFETEMKEIIHSSPREGEARCFQLSGQRYIVLFPRVASTPAVSAGGGGTVPQCRVYEPLP